MMIGRSRVASSSLTVRSTFHPSMPGSMTSSRTASGSSSAIARSPSSPVPATTTS